MNCPFCGKEMREGTIPVDGNSLRWHSKTEEDVVPLTEYAVFQKEAEAHYCPDCRQMILPVPEIKTFEEKVKEKWDAAAEKLSDVTQKLGRQIEEMQQQREKDKKKKNMGKDPWEL